MIRRLEDCLDPEDLAGGRDAVRNRSPVRIVGPGMGDQIVSAVRVLTPEARDVRQSGGRSRGASPRRNAGRRKQRSNARQRQKIFASHVDSHLRLLRARREIGQSTAFDPPPDRPLSGDGSLGNRIFNSVLLTSYRRCRDREKLSVYRRNALAIGCAGGNPIASSASF